LWPRGRGHFEDLTSLIDNGYFILSPAVGLHSANPFNKLK